MKLCMIGTGYVGLVSGVCFSDVGNIVYCVDKDKKKIETLNKGKVPIYEPGLEEILKRNYKAKRLFFTSDLNEAVKKSDIIFICVGTPTKKKSNSADLKYVFTVAKQLKKSISKYKIIITKSTVPVTTGDKIEKILRNLKKKKLIDVVSNPEFLREGEAIRDFIYPDRVVIGTDSTKANRILKSLYLPIIKKSSRYFKTSRRGAEMVKYASNAFLATKISFINEIANLCDEVGADVHHVSKAMGLDGRISPKFLHPGPGYGGSCFPKDTRALAYFGKENGVSLKVINSVIETNDNQKIKIFEKIKSLCDEILEKKTVSLLGLSFKPETDDIRESPAKTIIQLLVENGARVNVYDPCAMNNFKK